tara:strand:+ start:646 stop:1266 length:621 start_codon:yes stop_codon:yes gene_type:complete
MRLIFCFFILINLSSCQHTTNKNNLNAILAYINSNVKQNKFDIRIYNPPSPPESKENLAHGGNIKHDSIIAKLEPLHLYISDSIQFDKNFLYKNRDSIKGFSFLKGVINSKKQSIFLNLNILKNGKNIVIEPIGTDKFFELYPDIRFNNNYGGMLSFKNLFVSKDGNKAYFEVIYFKHRLNAQKSAIYAEFKNNIWVFKSRMISIS